MFAKTFIAAQKESYKLCITNHYLCCLDVGKWVQNTQILVAHLKKQLITLGVIKSFIMFMKMYKH